MNINENGADLTPEQIKALQDKVAALDVISQKAEQAEKDKNALIEELKVERQKKQLAESALAGKDGAGDPEAKTREIVERALAEKESKQIETTRQEFENKFKNSNPEFNPANDVGGLKYAAFKKVLDRFNTQGLRSEQELAQVYNDALLIMSGGKQSPAKPNNSFGFSPTGKSDTQLQSDDDELSPKEKKLLENSGWTKEKYLKFRGTQPQFVEQLLNSVRD